MAFQAAQTSDSSVVWVWSVVGNFNVNSLFQIHSWLRFLVLALNLAFLGVAARGHFSRAPFSKGGKVLGSAWVGVMHLQVLVGAALALSGFWQPRDLGHVVLIVAGVAIAQVLMSVNRRAPTPGWKKPMLAALISLVSLTLGIFAIGKMPWSMTAM
jgi:hypothetical protein